MTSVLMLSQITASNLTEIFKTLKTIYKAEEVDPARKEYITGQVKKYGYLPYPHIKALEELSPAETIIGLEEKFAVNKVYANGVFSFNDDEVSPVRRAGFQNSSWVKAEQHNIKLINLAGLGNGNESKEVGRFIDWLKQILILPAGNPEKGVLGTTAYLIPFHPRDFGCAYLPTSSDVSVNIEDPVIKENLSLNAKDQVRLFLAFTQLAGHPTMYDVLPQTGRFSKTILASPYVARWFDIKDLISNLQTELDGIAENIKSEFHGGDVDYVKDIISKSLNGEYEDISESHKHIADKIEAELDNKRKFLSNEMLLKPNQEILHSRAIKIINDLIGKAENAVITEEDITNQNEIIGELIKNGLWPAPGGAWCSSGIPVFNKMSQGAGYPMFKHYDHEENDVTHFANLDCQTPYYFVCFESGEYNENIIEFYINFLKKIQSDYNFDGFRVDHIDHIVDKFSENEQGQPISYRAPRYVLGRANTALKNDIPYFATLAEYMLWENFFKEYHQDMNFDLLWGSDIVSQYLKSPVQITEDNQELEEYNSTINQGDSRLSILKTYNNQDGEFRAIDQYPGQLGQKGALFKWFKFKFLPGGKLAQRPVLYIDGDESFTKVGIEKVIGAEESMERSKDYEFYRYFNAINLFALNNDLTRYGIAEILVNSDDQSGFASWYIRKDNGYNDDERLMIVANEKAPTELFRKGNEDGSVEILNLVGEPVYNKEVYIPEGFRIVSEYNLSESAVEFEERTEIDNVYDNKLVFDKLDPSEFRIYKLVRV